MKWGIITLFCAICGRSFQFNGSSTGNDRRHHKEFGWCCSKSCYDEAEKKYVRMILGHDEP